MSPTATLWPESPRTYPNYFIEQAASLFSPHDVEAPDADASKELAYRPPHLVYRDYLRATLPKGWTADAEHIRIICEHLDAVERGEIDRLAVHMPPRHAKTETVSVRYAPYCLEIQPRENVLLTGYNERFARRLGRKARTIAQGRIDLDPDKQAADEWAARQGGVVMTRGVGSPPTGTGFRRIIVDDPVRRREDAESETYREKVWDWYTDDLYTRLEPGGALILVMTLWHDDDLGARAVASEPGRWTVLKLAALAEEGDPLGRKVGEPLWPARYDADALQRIRSVLVRNEGERSWQALYQQNATEKEGDLFKVGNLKYLSPADVPASLACCRAWDIAATEGGGDWTAGVKIGKAGKDGPFYVLDVRREQLGPEKADAQIVSIAGQDGRDVEIHGAQDPGAAGKRDAARFVRMLAGYVVRTERVTGAKEMRARGLASQVNAGNVYVVRGTWNRDFVEELRTFPNGKHDDQTDAAADAFNALTSRPEHYISR